MVRIKRWFTLAGRPDDRSPVRGATAHRSREPDRSRDHRDREDRSDVPERGRPTIAASTGWRSRVVDAPPRVADRLDRAGRRCRAPSSPDSSGMRGPTRCPVLHVRNHAEPDTSRPPLDPEPSETRTAAPRGLSSCPSTRLAGQSPLQPITEPTSRPRERVCQINGVSVVHFRGSPLPACGRRR